MDDVCSYYFILAYKKKTQTLIVNEFILHKAICYEYSASKCNTATEA